MLLDVKPILRDPGTRLPFRFTMDLSDLEFSGRHPVSREVTVEGEVYSSADVLHLDLTARTTLDAVCDRCGKAFAQDKEVPYSCMLAQEFCSELKYRKNRLQFRIERMHIKRKTKIFRKYYLQEKYFWNIQLKYYEDRKKCLKASCCLW